MREKITKEQAIDDLRKLFNTTSFEDRKYGRSFNDEGDFFIDRKECGFYSVLQKLMEYFSDKVITDGICRVEATSIRWTMFHIKTKDD